MSPTTGEELALRRDALAGSSTLRRLAARLRRLVAPLLDRPLYLPESKAQLTQDGGVCAVDGTRLRFDPLSPDAHECPRCGRIHRGPRHHRAWIWPYHLWLSERVIHLALLGRLTGEEALVARAGAILRAYAALYPTVPNRDNVLGPSRLFFSTYLESIWLTQVVMGAFLFESEDADLRTVLEPMVRESVRLLASFDEGFSNRQVWNNTAIIAAGRWLGDYALLDWGLGGLHGIRAQLDRAVTRTGLWYEGENYHFFALRGFVLAAEALRPEGVNLYADSPKLTAMYVAPLATLLPDLTLPARGDAPFGVSIRQPRFAELWEIGWARTGDERLERLLAALYAAEAPEGEDAGMSDVAEQETNRPPTRLSRDRLSWKALRWMRPEPPTAAPEIPRSGSRLVAEQGLAVLRPEEGRYLSVECGGRPGGHGHPDVLHLTVVWGEALFLDFGTASYVSPSLHWYRSTLAHNAPGVAGRGQRGRHGWCAAFETRDRWAWCRAIATDVLGSGSRAARTVIVGPDYVLDLVDVDPSADTTVDLPLHPVAGLRELPDVPAADTWAPANVVGHEHGYHVVDGVRRWVIPPTNLRIPLGTRAMELLLVPRVHETVYAATAPGPPEPGRADGIPLSFLVRRAVGPGRWIQAYAPVDRIAQLEVSAGEVLVHRTDGRTERLTVTEQEVHVRTASGGTVTLTGRQPAQARPAEVPPVPRVMPCPRLDEVPGVGEWLDAVPEEAVVELGATQYRRSEVPYGERGSFSARAAVFATGSAVGFAVDVDKAPLSFRTDASGPGLDNEPPDIHSDGVQCYVGAGTWEGYVVVPEPPTSTARVRAVAGSGADPERVDVRWCPTASGYRLVLTVDIGRPLQAGDRVPVNLVINEMYGDRERRAGQLVLSGDGGWVYLRGDREPAEGAVIAEVR